MERAKGVEPSTFSLATRRSTTELCPLIKKLLQIEVFFNSSNNKKCVKCINKKNKQLKEKILKKSKIDKKDIVIISNKNVRAFDKNTGFQTGHVSQRNSGDWKKALSSEEIEIINSQFKNFLIENNYD